MRKCSRVGPSNLFPFSSCCDWLWLYLLTSLLLTLQKKEIITISYRRTGQKGSTAGLLPHVLLLPKQALPGISSNSPTPAAHDASCCETAWHRRRYNCI